MAGPAVLSAGDAPPRLVLVTDGDVGPASRGAGRTLVNLFARWPTDRLLIATSASAQPARDEHGHRVLPARGWLRGGLAERVAPLLGEMNAAWASVRPLPLMGAIRDFAPQLTLVVPTDSTALVWGERALRAVAAPAVTYLMDEWMSAGAHAWPGGNALATTRRLLDESTAWLAISEPLAARMTALAGTRRPTLVVHNPVTLEAAPPAALAAPREGPYRIAYAGSIWPMHLDAIVAVAESTARLRAQGHDVRLVLHTDAHGWNAAATTWEALGVEHGGIVPYAALRERLGEYDLLLVASAFDAAHAALSRSSLQTKVTDYLAVGRPILACGPTDAASNVYLRAHDCAWLLESTASEVVDRTLARCIDARAEGQEMARRGYELVRREHDAERVSARLYAFLAAAARPGPGAR
ncbi:MAG: hypothetical protein HYR75_07840 [Gemmatimonadetes bacterium]|nr:hypothetical protein [Gemmatimonadota bacterium]MBI3569475.1 hypothetical protein [Gemmatimonadota bacterium]